MKVMLGIFALSALAPVSQEKELYSTAATHLARSMKSELDVISVELVVVEMSTESPKDDAPIVVINDSLRSQIRAFRALVKDEVAKHEEDLRAVLRASIVIGMLRWELGNAKRFEAVKESFTEDQWKRISHIFIEMKDLTPTSIKSLLGDHMKAAKRACDAILERLPK